MSHTTAGRTGWTSPTRPCASGPARCSNPTRRTPNAGSCWTVRRSTRAAAATRKGDDPYLIPAEGDPVPPPGTEVSGAVEDDRRTLLMRTHSGLHVLCGVVFRDFGALVTGGNMEPGEARMDFNLPEVPADFKARLEELVNAEVVANRRVDVQVLPRERALALPDIIRTQSNLIPADEAEIRIVDIVGLDVQADGGTHVASTVQIGKVQVVKVESKGKANRRVRVRLAD